MFPLRSQTEHVGTQMPKQDMWGNSVREKKEEAPSPIQMPASDFISQNVFIDLF